MVAKIVHAKSTDKDELPKFVDDLCTEFKVEDGKCVITVRIYCLEYIF